MEICKKAPKDFLILYLLSNCCSLWIIIDRFKPKHGKIYYFRGNKMEARER